MPLNVAVAMIIVRLLFAIFEILGRMETKPAMDEENTRGWRFLSFNMGRTAMSIGRRGRVLSILPDRGGNF